MIHALKKSGISGASVTLLYLTKLAIQVSSIVVQRLANNLAPFAYDDSDAAQRVRTPCGRQTRQVPCMYSCGRHPLARPIDVRFDPKGEALFILDFGQFEMKGGGGIAAESNSGKLWRLL